MLLKKFTHLQLLIWIMILLVPTLLAIETTNLALI